MNGACNDTFLAPPPGALGRGQKVNIIKYHLISITKSITKIFKPNFECLLRNERYKTYQTGFPFGCLGHAPGVRHMRWDFHSIACRSCPRGGGLRGTFGDQNIFSFKFNQIWCVNYMNGTCNSTIFWVPASWGLGEGPKSLKSQLQSQFQRFLN